MQGAATRRRDTLVEGLAHEVVGEAVAARVVLLHDQPGGQRRLDDLEDLVVGGLLDAREHVQTEGVGRQRGDREELLRTVGELGQPAPDHLAHARRHLGRVRRLQQALAAQQPHQLPEEEGVAGGAAMEAGDEATGRGGAGRAGDETADVAFGQAPQRDPLDDGLPGEPGQRLGERMTGADLDVPVGAEDEHAGVAHHAGREGEQAQRRDIGPMQVVEHDHQRAV